MSVLDDLGRAARSRVGRDRAECSESDLLARAAVLAPARPVLTCLRAAGRPAVVAEFKRSSPSAGAIRPEAEPAEVARAYAGAGAAMVSVLTEPTRFGGRLEDLATVHAACHLPVLQKDFVVDPYQLAQARVAGADAVLLIVALVRDDLDHLLARARALGLTALVEAHTDEELDLAIRSGARLIGVNNRDLASLQVDTRTAERLLLRVPADRFALAESGLSSVDDVARAVRAGADGVLVGEYLMRSERPAETVAALGRAARPFVKICGITRRTDAVASAEAGADAIGFNFAQSPRRIDPLLARELGRDLAIERFGVFSDATVVEMLDTVERAGLTGVQLHDARPRPELVATLRAGGVSVLMAAGTDREGVEAARVAFEAGALPLLDARLGPRPDGRGGTLDVAAAADAALRVRRVLVAGGLGPENVAQALQATGAFGVDVASGVEVTGRPGIKDEARITAFVDAARRRWREGPEARRATEATAEEERYAPG